MRQGHWAIPAFSVRPSCTRYCAAASVLRGDQGTYQSWATLTLSFHAAASPLQTCVLSALCGAGARFTLTDIRVTLPCQSSSYFLKALLPKRRFLALWKLNVGQPLLLVIGSFHIYLNELDGFTILGPLSQRGKVSGVKIWAILVTDPEPGDLSLWRLAQTVAISPLHSWGWWGWRLPPGVQLL